MMKNKILLGCLFLAALLIGCFDDEGTYDYKEINGPVWDYNYSSSPVYIRAYEGDSTKATVPMHFEGDSSNFRFEWRTYDGKLFCEERVLAISTDTLFSRLGITSYTEIPQTGTFTAVDQSTGMKFVARLWFYKYGRYRRGNVLILSENGSNAKLSCYSQKTETVNGVSKVVYSLQDNVFEVANADMKLEGTPRGLYANHDNAISSSMAATTVLTSKGIYVVNNENMKFAGELKDEFMSGAPANFDVVSAFHRSRLSLLATADGKLYQRVKTASWLGGKFQSEPYIVDEKGYQVTGFGLGRTPSGGHISPCWDEKNRRILMIKMNSEPFNIFPLTYVEGAEYPDPVWAMPEGTEVLHLFAGEYYNYLGNVYKYSIIYNDKDGKTWLTDFIVNRATGLVVQHEEAGKQAFPGGNLPKGTKFLTSAASYGAPISNNYIFYSKGKEIHYVNRENNTTGSLMSSPFVANVVAFIYNASNIDYNKLYVALENGDFFAIDISNIITPKIIEETRFNVGGKIVDLLELAHNSYTDFYK